MLLSRHFISNILSNSDISKRVYSVVVDEAHCISNWGAQFRKKYSQLGTARAFLPQGVPFIALSASITPRVQADISTKLQFPLDYTYVNLGNNRENISIIVRAIQNPMSTFSDLGFVIPDQVSDATDIKKTWIYADNIETGCEIIDYLRQLVPISLRSAIRSYNAIHSIEYRDEVMEMFRIGAVRVLVCTDAAGMVSTLSKVSNYLTIKTGL
jgi:superfamily II DNA helicase RecQ